MRRFGNAKSEQICGHVAQAHGLEAVAPRDVAEIDEASRLEGGDALQHTDVVVHGDTGLDDFGIGKNIADGFRQGNPLELKKVSGLGSCQLQQCRRVLGAFTESGSGFGIESENALPCEPCEGLAQHEFAVHNMYGAVVTAQGEGVDFVLAETSFVKFQAAHAPCAVCGQWTVYHCPLAIPLRAGFGKCPCGIKRHYRERSMRCGKTLKGSSLKSLLRGRMFGRDISLAAVCRRIPDPGQRA